MKGSLDHSYEEFKCDPPFSVLIRDSFHAPKGKLCRKLGEVLSDVVGFLFFNKVI